MGLLMNLTYHRCRVWENSITLWKEVLEKYPDSKTAHLNLAIAHAENYEYQKTILHLTRAIEIDPKCVKAWNNRATFYFLTGEKEKALSDLKTALSISPDNINSLFNRATIHIKLGELDMALPDLTRVIELNADEESYALRANIYLEQKNYDKAWEDVHILQKAGHKIDPKLLEELTKATEKK
jgi:tetratricopeptide (TPR) repeat protein